MSVERIESEWSARQRYKVAAMTTLPQGFHMTAVPQAWVPVEERLPEGECRCLVAIGGEVRSATYYPPGKFQPEITHWMPLPEPPAE